MRQAPLRQDGPAARDDAGHPLGGERDVGQAHAGVDGEVIDALLALLDQRVAVDLPGQLFGLAADLLQRLIDRHRADRHRRVADDPLACLMDVGAGGEVHHRIGAPADRPHHLLHFLGDRRGDDGVADVGVDLHQEVAADDHRLAFGMVDVRRNDGAAARHFVAHELRRDVIGDGGAEGLAVARRLAGTLASEVLADGDVLHLRRDDARPRVCELRHRPARLAPQRRPARAAELRHHRRIAGIAARILLDVATRPDPISAQGRQAGPDVYTGGGIGVGTGGVVDPERLLVRRREIDLPNRHAQVGVALAGDVDLARGRQRTGGDGKNGGIFRHKIMSQRPRLRASRNSTGRWRRFQSLRRHDPDQVRRVPTSRTPRVVSQPLTRAPLGTVTRVRFSRIAVKRE